MNTTTKTNHLRQLSPGMRVNTRCKNSSNGRETFCFRFLVRESIQQINGVNAQKKSHEYNNNNNKKETPTATLTWHASKYKVQKLEQW